MGFGWLVGGNALYQFSKIDKSLNLHDILLLDCMQMGEYTYAW